MHESWRPNRRPCPDPERAELLRTTARVGVLVTVVLVFGACGPCGGSSTAGSGGDGCSHPGICLTLTGPLAGSSNGLVGSPDCIPGQGVDAVFVTNIAGRETGVEILVTDPTARSSPGFHAGTFTIKTRANQAKGTAYASVWVKADKDVSGFPGGWSTDIAGSSGTVVLDAARGGKVQEAVAAPASGSGSPLHISGSFHC